MSKNLVVSRVISIEGVGSGLSHFRSRVLQAALSRFCKRNHFRVIKKAAHRFTPQGDTIVWILAESHIVLHTWPEHGYWSLDVLLCGRARIHSESVTRFLNDLGAVSAVQGTGTRSLSRLRSRVSATRNVRIVPATLKHKLLRR
jgi:S-adenosylmethionine/arginine decarboxylase-like enzyme